jgi:hypothetical protein
MRPQFILTDNLSLTQVYCDVGIIFRQNDALLVVKRIVIILIY